MKGTKPPGKWVTGVSTASWWVGKATAMNICKMACVSDTVKKGKGNASAQMEARQAACLMAKPLETTAAANNHICKTKTITGLPFAGVRSKETERRFQTTCELSKNFPGVLRPWTGPKRAAPGEDFGEDRET